jgi:hypothetical protein
MEKGGAAIPSGSTPSVAPFTGKFDVSNFQPSSLSRPFRETPRLSSVVYDNRMTLGCAINNNEEHFE